MKHIIVSAQMGSCSNLIKNLLLLSTDLYWPTDVSRLDLAMAQYDPILKYDKTQWTAKEQDLHKTIKNPFMMSVTLDKVCDLNSRPGPSAYINHSLFWQWPEYSNEIFNLANVIFVAPTSMFGLEWQTRAATEKVIIPNFESQYDFCFEPENKEQSIQKYINVHGQDAYIAFNALNMREVFKQQQHTVKEQSRLLPSLWLALEDILMSPGELLYSTLTNHLGIEINLAEFNTVLDTWRELHWPIDTTFNWRYGKYTNL